MLSQDCAARNNHARNLFALLGYFVFVTADSRGLFVYLETSVFEVSALKQFKYTGMIWQGGENCNLAIL